MKILHLISSSGIGGAEMIILGLASRLAALGHENTLGVLDTPGNGGKDLLERANKQGVGAVAVPCHSRVDMATVKFIVRLTGELRPEVIHTHGYKSDMYGLMARPKGIRLVGTCHNWIVSSIKMGIYTYLDLLALRFFDTVVPVSSAVEQKLLRSGISRKRVRRIPNGIDLGRFSSSIATKEIRKEYGIPATTTIFCSIGRLSPEKGHDLLIEAFAELCRTHHSAILLIVGGGRSESLLREMLGRLGVTKKVLLVGEQADIPRYLAAANIFVLPSRAEGLPIALLEALAAGVPVIATAVGEVSAVLGDGSLGLVVPPNDKDALTKAMGSILAHYGAAQSRAAAGRKQVAERYSIHQTAKAYLEVYQAGFRNLVRGAC